MQVGDLVRFKPNAVNQKSKLHLVQSVFQMRMQLFVWLYGHEYPYDINLLEVVSEATSENR